MLALLLHLVVLAWWGQAVVRSSLGEGRTRAAHPVAWQVRWGLEHTKDHAPVSGDPVAASAGETRAQPAQAQQPASLEAPVQPPAQPPVQSPVQSSIQLIEGAGGMDSTPTPSQTPTPTTTINAITGGGLTLHGPHGHAAGTTAVLPSGPPRPVLPTRIPADFEQNLQVRRGGQSGHARWAWAVHHGRYRSSLTADVGGRSGAAVLDWTSQGGVDEHGVSPDRFLSRPARGGARAVNFQRDGGVVSYSGPTGHAALVAGAQDRLSWMAQVLAIVQARLDQPGSAGGAPQQLPPRLPIWVAGPQGDGGDWWFEVHRSSTTGCWHFRRQAERRYDVQVDLWVAGPPAAPVARLARLVMGPDGGRQAAWELRDSELALACGVPP